MRLSRFCCGTADAKILASTLRALYSYRWKTLTARNYEYVYQGPNLASKLLDRLRRIETVASVFVLSPSLLFTIIFAFCSFSFSVQSHPLLPSVAAKHQPVPSLSLLQPLNRQHLSPPVIRLPVRVRVGRATPYELVLCTIAICGYYESQYTEALRLLDLPLRSSSFSC